MYNALIIGAGLIAGGFDKPQSESILTHAHAYINNPKINLLGFYDIDYNNALIMAKKWNVNAYRSLDDIANLNVDIISICTPDEYHLSAVQEAQKFKPKIFFLEKPICKNKEDFIKLQQIKTPILVNYSRSFSKDFQMLSNKIKNNEFGDFETGTAFYGKGFIHNGSHMINLLNLLIGKINSIENVKEINDFYCNDTTKSSIIRFENNKILTLNGCDCRNYTIFECDLIFEKARIRILNSGFDIEIYKVVESEKYIGYKILSLKESIKTDLDFVMANAVKNIVDFLDNKTTLQCTLQDGYEAIKYA